MKTFAIIFFLCILSMYVKAQEWAPVGAIWHYTEEFFMPVTIDIDYIKFESVKDTMYNGKLCRQIIKRHSITCSDRPMVEYMYSQSEKVWFWDPNFNAFQVLYDFSVTPGNSWVILVGDFIHSDVDSLIVRVDSTEIVLINGVQLKKLYVTYDFRNETAVPFTYQGAIIQSIGDLYFMFNYCPEYLFGCDGNFSSGLRCYQDSVTGLYETGIAPSCTYVHQFTGIRPEPAELSRIRIYPNPADEEITVSTDIAGPILFTIADLTGRTVNSGLVTGSAIKTGNLKPGIYKMFFQQHGEPFTESKKLVIR